MARIKYNERFRIFLAQIHGNQLSFMPASFIEGANGDIAITNETGLKIRVSENTIVDIIADIVMDGSNDKAQVRIGTAIIQRRLDGKLVANVQGGFTLPRALKYQLRFSEEAMMETPTLKHMIKSWLNNHADKKRRSEDQMEKR